MNYFNYFSEIEELFIRRRGRNLLLSPLDWALIESWQEREVPLHIILRGIEKVFDAADKQPNKKRTIKSLLYCKEEIEAQFAEWLESQVGKSSRQSAVGSQQSAVDSQKQAEKKVEKTAETNSSKSELFPDDAIAAHLENVSGELNNAASAAEGDWRGILESVLKQVNQLKQKADTAENLEGSLEKLDALIDENLLLNFETERLKPEVEKQIASYKTKMEPEVYQRTFDLMMLKRLREQENIPRLSLFYL